MAPPANFGQLTAGDRGGETPESEPGSDTDTDVEPQGEGQSGTETKKKAPSSQRYRKQRDQLLGLMEDGIRSQGERMDRLESAVERFIESQTPKQRSSGGGGPFADWTDEQLRDFVQSDEHARERPTAWAEALTERNRRIAETAITKTRDELTTGFKGQLDARDRRGQVLRLIATSYPDMMDARSELRALAQKNIASYEKRYGVEDVAQRPEYLWFSVTNAADELGIRPETDAADEGEPEGESGSVAEPGAAGNARTSRTAGRKARPPAGSLSEGGGEGAPSRVPTLKPLLEKRDTGSVSRELARALFPERYRETAR